MKMVELPDLSFVARIRLWSAELVGLRLQEETVDSPVYDGDGAPIPGPTSGANAAASAGDVHWRRWLNPPSFAVPIFLGRPLVSGCGAVRSGPVGRWLNW
jgi:hypothetical protein